MKIFLPLLVFLSFFIANLFSQSKASYSIELGYFQSGQFDLNTIAEENLLGSTFISKQNPAGQLLFKRNDFISKKVGWYAGVGYVVGGIRYEFIPTVEYNEAIGSNRPSSVYSPYYIASHIYDFVGLSVGVNYYPIYSERSQLFISLGPRYAYTIPSLGSSRATSSRGGERVIFTSTQLMINQQEDIQFLLEGSLNYCYKFKKSRVGIFASINGVYQLSKPVLKGEFSFIGDTNDAFYQANFNEKSSLVGASIGVVFFSKEKKKE